MASKKASDGLQDDKFIQMNVKLEKMNQSMREEMHSKLEQMNEASMMKFEQIMGESSSSVFGSEGYGSLQQDT
jgi:flagellar basal body-associated protein FliL